jgi:hypothetical protein
MRWVLKKAADLRRAVEKPEAVWIAAILLLAACALAISWFPLRFIDALPSKDYNEGWNAYRQWMAFEGELLYGVRSVFWTTNYPFLSFHIVGLLGGAEGNMVLAGRELCFAGLVAVAVLAGGIVWDATGSRAGAIYAGLLLFTALGAFHGSSRAVDDPDLLSAVFATGGLFAYMRAPRGLSWTVLAAGAFCFSLFTKPDFIAFPLSVAADLAVTRNWRPFAVFAAVGLAVSAGLLELSFHFDGRYFFAELLQPRAYDFEHLGNRTWHYLQHFCVPVAVGLLVLWRGKGIRNRLPLGILLIFTNLGAIGFVGGDGVASNVFFPAVIADLLACAIGVCWLERQDRRVFGLTLAGVTLSMAAVVPFQFHDDLMAARQLPAATAAARQAIALLEAARGPAICEDLLLCYRAGKQMDYDPYYVKDQILVGHIAQSGITALIAAHHYAVIQFDGASDGPWPAEMTLRFTDSVQRAVLATYHPVLITRYYVIFVPSDSKTARMFR